MKILEVRGVAKWFGGLPAVDNVDLDVDEGQILAIIGPNGAGKSTLLKMLGGVLPPSSSDGIVFRGTELTGLRPHRIRQLGVAEVLQTPRMFESMTVLENVALGALFGGPHRRSEADALRVATDQLERLGIGDRAGWAVGRLGLHQRRTVELARALAGDPWLLLLDEVMAGLNPGELDSYLAMVRRVRDERGVTIVWVEHVMRAVNELADRVLVLHLGRQLAQGRPDQVMGDRAVIEAYLGRGAGGHAQG